MKSAAGLDFFENLLLLENVSAVGNAGVASKHIYIHAYTCSCQNTQSLNIYIVGPQLINRFSSRRIFISSFVYKLGQTCVVIIEWYIYNLLCFQKYICINNSVRLNVLEQWWASKLSLGTNFKLEDNPCELLLCLRYRSS